MKNPTNSRIRNLSSYIRVLLVVLLSTACQLENEFTNSQNKLIVKDFNINQRDISGILQWTMDSPSAEYSYDKSILKAKKPQITIYKSNNNNIILTSDTLKSLNNNNLILLNGNINLNLSNQADSFLKAASLTWEVNNSQLIIDKEPYIETTTVKITPEAIIYNYSTETVKFEGDTNYIFKPKPEEESRDLIQISSNGGNWDTTSGDIYSRKNVSISKFISKSKENILIKAASFKANILNGEIELEQCQLTNEDESVTISDTCMILNAIEPKNSYLDKNSNKNEGEQNSNTTFADTNDKPELIFKGIKNKVKTKIKLVN